MGVHVMVFLSCKEIKRVPWAGPAVLAAARPVPEVWWDAGAGRAAAAGPVPGDPPLAAGASAEPFFRLHFLGSLAPIELGTVAGDKSCIHCTNRAPKRQYTDSFFALCEN